MSTHPNVQTPRPNGGPLARRGLLLGAGAAALAAGAAVTGQPAQARPRSLRDDVDTRVHAMGTPATDSLGSAPLSGYTYRYVCQYDFFPFNPASQRTWGGSGVYTASAAGALRASVDVPPGTLLREVEYYVYNASGSEAPVDTFLTVPGQGSVTSVGGGASVASTGQLSAVKVVLPAASRGPYPVSSKLLVSISTGISGQVQINGARLGFSNGAAATGLLSAPRRVYDSRLSGGRLGAGSIRTVTLPADVVAPGTTGVLINLTAVNGSKPGNLRVFSGAATTPTASALNFAKSTAIANALTVAVSAKRQIKVYASAAVDIVVDVTGTVG